MNVKSNTLHKHKYAKSLTYSNNISNLLSYYNSYVKKGRKKKKLIHIFKLCTLHSAQQTIFRAFGKWIWFRHAKFGFLILIWPKNAQYVVEKCCIGVDIWYMSNMNTTLTLKSSCFIGISYNLIWSKACYPILDLTNLYDTGSIPRYIHAYLAKVLSFKAWFVQLSYLVLITTSYVPR